MKREIKFKAFINGKMECLADINGLGGWDDGSWQIDNGTIECDTYMSLDQVELLQYTGMKDKNGVEIYDGDVLRGVSANEFSKGDVSRYKVMWGIDHWHIEGTGFCMQELFNYCKNDVMVIGNIYENKNLI